MGTFRTPCFSYQPTAVGIQQPLPQSVYASTAPPNIQPTPASAYSRPLASYATTAPVSQQPLIVQPGQQVRRVYLILPTEPIYFRLLHTTRWSVSRLQFLRSIMPFHHSHRLPQDLIWYLRMVNRRTHRQLHTHRMRQFLLISCFLYPRRFPPDSTNCTSF